MTDKPTEQPDETIADPMPVPDKGGWIDGETGQVLPVPAPEPKAAPKTTKKAS